MQSSDETQRTLETVSESDGEPASHRAPVPGLTILAHPNPERVGETTRLASVVIGGSVALGRLEPAFEPIETGSSHPLGDPRLSRSPILFHPQDDGVRLDAAGTKTRLFVDGAETQTLVVDAERLRRGVVLTLGSRTALMLHFIEPAASLPPRFGLVGDSDAVRRLRREIERVADLDIPVLLRGESGTGKELVARAVAKAGRRRDEPYHAINMAAIPPNLAASELFGAAKGAFSGADKRRPGYFERADGGTLFLDEVGEMPVEVQALLLRALESGEIQPVGSEMPQKVDVRVIAATDADLEKAIEEGRFRAPLLHRLASFEIELPPLRERRDDVGRLFFHFLREELDAIGEEDRLRDVGGGNPFVDAELMTHLALFDWPGNVRQLRNVARQAAVASRGAERLSLGSRMEKILAAKAPTGADESAPPTSPERPPTTLVDAPVEKSKETSTPESTGYRDRSEVDEDELIAALKAHQYRIQPAAKALGVSRTALYALIDACPRIRKAGDLTREEIEASGERHAKRLAAMADDLGVSLQGLKMRMKELGLRS